MSDTWKIVNDAWNMADDDIFIVHDARNNVDDTFCIVAATGKSVHHLQSIVKDARNIVRQAKWFSHEV